MHDPVEEMRISNVSSVKNTDTCLEIVVVAQIRETTGPSLALAQEVTM